MIDSISTKANKKLTNKIAFLDCVAAVERLPAIHFSVDFNLLSFEIMGFIVEP